MYTKQRQKVPVEIVKRKVLVYVGYQPREGETSLSYLVLTRMDDGARFKARKQHSNNKHSDVVDPNSNNIHVKSILQVNSKKVKLNKTAVRKLSTSSSGRVAGYTPDKTRSAVSSRWRVSSRHSGTGDVASKGKISSGGGLVTE